MFFLLEPPLAKFLVLVLAVTYERSFPSAPRTLSSYAECPGSRTILGGRRERRIGRREPGSDVYDRLRAMIRTSIAAGTALFAALTLTSCVNPLDLVESPTPSPEPTPTTAPENDDASGDYAAALAEREQFMQDQQLPLDGSLLKAVTPEQKEFIAEQRAHFEPQGGTWKAETESVTLALTADACETAILSFHDVDSTTVVTHIQTSPLFATLIPSDLTGESREDAEANVASIMVFGMRYMCPDDHPQWKTAFDELYPGHGGG